eukprot:TRINITY_DN14763_c0_g1_i1.p1 TRINITY_DN14763_c0_g1~~TRINITY_DN14763_c0_g1_i1.p1  ORF type:complete len:586 (-),score=162.12 TRINITY_DN14763_c0_g1_i1:95-1852(-)
MFDRGMSRPGISRGDARVTHKGFYGAWIWKEKSSAAIAKFLESRVKRYFQIDFDRGILSYSVETAVRQIIPFRQILGAERAEQVAWSKTGASSGLKRSLSSVFSSTEPQHSFVLLTEDRKMTLSTHSEQDATAWVAALNKAHELGQEELARKKAAAACPGEETLPKSPSLASESTAAGVSEDGEQGQATGFRALAAVSSGHERQRAASEERCGREEADDEVVARSPTASAESAPAVEAAESAMVASPETAEALPEGQSAAEGLSDKEPGEHWRPVERGSREAAAAFEAEDREVAAAVSKRGSGRGPTMALDAAAFGCDGEEQAESSGRQAAGLDARDFGFDDDEEEGLEGAGSVASSPGASPPTSPRSLACTSESTAVEQTEQKTFYPCSADVSVESFASTPLPTRRCADEDDVAANTAAADVPRLQYTNENIESDGSDADESSYAAAQPTDKSAARIAADLDLLAKARRRSSAKTVDESGRCRRLGEDLGHGYHSSEAPAPKKEKDAEGKPKKRKHKEGKEARAKGSAREAAACAAEPEEQAKDGQEEQERQARVAADLRLLRQMHAVRGPPASQSLPRSCATY